MRNATATLPALLPRMRFGVATFNGVFMIWSVRCRNIVGAFALLGNVASFAQSPSNAETVASAAGAASVLNATTVTTAPVAAKKPKDVTVHGDARIDDYFWLREKTNTEVIDYLKAENAYADAFFKPLMPLQETLYKEMLGRIKQTDAEVPYKRRGYWYTSLTQEGQQHAVHVRRKGSDSAADEVMLDVNALAKDKPGYRIMALSVSPSDRLLAYVADETGGLDGVLYVKDLTSGAALPIKIRDVTEVSWSEDSKHLFYVTQDAAKRTHRVYRHTLGSKAKDALIFEEKDELFWVSISKTRTGRFIMISTASKDETEVRVLDAKTPLAAPRLVEARRNDFRYEVFHHSDSFYILANDRGINNRLVKTSIHQPQQRFWKEIVAHRSDVMLEDLDLFERFMVLRERDRGVPKLRVTQLDRNESHYVDFGEAVYSIRGAPNAEFDATQYRFGFASLVTPNSTFDYDLVARTRVLKKQQPVIGYEAKLYKSERFTAKASDGTEIPISLVYRVDKRGAAPQPLLLTGYGAYGYPYDVGFSSARVSLLDRGVVFAIAHIRGGGDLGRAWYQGGKLLNKKNSFSDFISCSEALISRGYTNKERLVIEGGSAGGLLMGAVTNLRPDLFKAVVAEVPFMDVINTMLDETIPLTVGEFKEWGNPKEKISYDAMRAYSPYDNLVKRAYPAMFVRTGLNDSQVAYWEPAKYVAKLRTLKTDSNPLLMSVNLGAGHGGSSGRYDALKETAQTFSFMLSQWGLTN
jgi:oligopeptidase B